MNNFKDNLNLPETPFPMKGDLARREPDMLAQWIKDDVYGLIRKAKEGKPVFVLHDGPPYANGSIHLGHVCNKVLKDIILKSKGLEGYDSPYIPGWDCHGLPIEHKVESVHGKAGEKIEASEFRKLCREYAANQVDIQRQDFIRMGVFGDWYNPYLTMNFETEGSIIETLGKIVKNGHVYKGFKPIYWCSDCGSALAEAEVEYQDKKSNSIYVAFKSNNQAEIAGLFGLSTDISVEALIWTTTPWTIPANKAISVNEEFDYQAAKVTLGEDVRYLIVAVEMLETLKVELKATAIELVGNQIKGKELELKSFLHPLYNFEVPILLGDHVSLDAGTGLVHTAPDHGVEDFNICKQYDIQVADLLDKETKFKSNVEFFAGIKALDANVPVIKELFNHGGLIAKSTIVHSYPHCWRHKTPLMYRATPQWFISMEVAGLRKTALQQIKETKWIPSWGEARIETMLTNRPDWCISRQRIWGVPITLFTHKLTGALHPRTDEIFAKASQVVRKGGIQAWWDLKDSYIIDDAEDYDRVTDTLDVWFDSGSTNISVVDQRPEFKGNLTDIYLEGSDQHRGWFMSSLMISCAVKKIAPYKAVLTHGFVVDGKGRKMSKSIGNVIVPKEVTDSLGADILRLWIAATDYSSEMSVSQEILKRSAESYRRIRNTARFLLANLNGFNPKTDIVPFNQMIEIDLWAVNLAKQVQEEIIKFTDDYGFHLVVQRILKFCSIEMGSFYLDVIKDRQYTAKKDSIARRSCQTAIYYIADALVKWISPILSFTAQEIWENFVGADSKYIFTQEYFKFADDLPGVNNDSWTDMLELRSQVNISLEQMRKDKVIGSSLEANADLYLDDELLAKVSRLGDELRFILLTSAVFVYPLSAKPEGLEECIPNKLAVSVSKNESAKCDRCWHHVATVGQDQRDLTLCDRCITNVYGDGEQRKFA